MIQALQLSDGSMVCIMTTWTDGQETLSRPKNQLGTTLRTNCVFHKLNHEIVSATLSAVEYLMEIHFIFYNTSSAVMLAYIYWSNVRSFRSLSLLALRHSGDTSFKTPISIELHSNHFFITIIYGSSINKPNRRPQLVARLASGLTLIRCLLAWCPLS